MTHNEEARLGAALASVSFCDETVVLDAGSTDRTRDIALSFGARVHVNTPWPGYVVQRNLALDLARHDWVLVLDADERVTAALRAEIEHLRERGFTRDGYRIPRVAHYMGHWIRGTDWYPDPQLRLFDRRRGRWVGSLIHESVRVRGSVGRLTSELEHLPYFDLADHLRRIDRYTTLWAEEAHARGRRANPLELVFTPLWAFARNYVLRRGLALGSVGLTVSTVNAFYTYLKVAKLYERGRASA
jgi:glycosyltransferase involved in cell wall biosynthesis